MQLQSDIFRLRERKGSPLPDNRIVPIVSPYLTISEAAKYTRFSASGLRSCIQRGELTPDVRGSRRQAMFRVETLDRFLEARLRYSGATHTGPGEGDEREEDQIPRGAAATRRPLLAPCHGCEPEDRKETKLEENNHSVLGSRGKQAPGIPARRAATRSGGRRAAKAASRRCRDFVATHEDSLAEAGDS